MFYYLDGTVAEILPYLAVIDCGGVGYACRTTNNTLSHLQKGKPAKLYTHLNVREDAMELFGFSTENELNCFQLLTSVSGVGPKAALSILSAATPESLAMSIITGDEKALTVAQGIGKKIAQRIILELKDKLAKGQIAPKGESYGGTGVTVIPQNKSSEAAAALAHADDFIRRLPQGYDTMLTGNGANLSQGQRQLLAIARAAVADPPVMILDEATSSIDTRTEAIVQQGMDSLMYGRTVFVIAHRLSTVRNSNAIMVLDHGRIVERGDHDDLIRQHGLYYQLYTGAFELE